MNSGKIRVQQWVFEAAMSHQAFVQPQNRKIRGMPRNKIWHKYVTALIPLINALRMY